MALTEKVSDRTYTYADILKFDEGARAELADGELYMMAPPLTEHQGILMELAYRIRQFLEGKPCKVFPAPFGVHLNPQDDEDHTFFEPDITVICDQSKIREQGCFGAPDMVVEIISPSTASRDRVLKFRRYQEAGVREYWIVDPDAKIVQACLLENGRYMVTGYDADDTVPVSILSGCKINLKDVFGE
jgi:Uma2 family endonuclease